MKRFKRELVILSFLNLSPFICLGIVWFSRNRVQRSPCFPSGQILFSPYFFTEFFFWDKLIHDLTSPLVYHNEMRKCKFITKI